MRLEKKSIVSSYYFSKREAVLNQDKTEYDCKMCTMKCVFILFQCFKNFLYKF